MALRSKDHRPLTWDDKRRGKTPNYKYSTIEDICSGSVTGACNVYGIISDFKPPTNSRGSGNAQALGRF